MRRKGDSFDNQISRFAANESPVGFDGNRFPGICGLKKRMLAEDRGWYSASEQWTPTIAEKKSRIFWELKIRLRMVSAQTRTSSRIVRTPDDRALSMSMPSDISRRAGEAGEETDMIRESRLMAGLISAILGYCFWDNARPETDDMRKYSRS